MPEAINQFLPIRVPLKVFNADGTEAIGKTLAVVISKNGGAFANPAAGATNATEIGSGWYYWQSTAPTDTGTAGPLIVRGTASGCDPSEAVYDICLQPWDGTCANPSPDASNFTFPANDVAGAPVPNTTFGQGLQLLVWPDDGSVAPMVITLGAKNGANKFAIVAGNGGTAISNTWHYSFLAGKTNVGAVQDTVQTAVDVGAKLDVATGTRLAASSYTAPDNATIASTGTAVASTATAVTAIKAKTDNLPADPADASDIAASFAGISATLATIAGYVDTEVAAIKAKTDNLPSDPADASDIAALIGAVSTALAAVKAKTDQLAFTAANKLDANMLALNGDAAAAANLAKSGAAIGRGTVGAGSSNTVVVCSAFTPAGIDPSQFANRIMLFDANTTTAALRGQAASITVTTGADPPTMTVTGLTRSPAAGDTFSVL